MLHFDLHISGKVQGVWYRKSAQLKAQELGIKGIIKNLPDGSVYAEAEGHPDALQAFMAWCQEGPPMSEVAEVIVKEAPSKGYQTFEVLR